MTILGIDISKWNGNWNAEKAKQAGAAFVFVKSSQATYTDPQFKLNWQKAKDAGILRGAYHYLDYTKPAADQANYFADLLQDDPGELPPVIDYEHAVADNNPATALGYLKTWLDEVTKRTELFADATIKVPMVYTGWGFWGSYGEQTNKDYWIKFPLWVAHYTTSSAPLLPTAWPIWNFWQFTGKGPGEAFGSESLSIDMNRFNGTMNELLEFIGITQVGDLDNLFADYENRLLAVEEGIASISESNSPAVEDLAARVTAVEEQADTTSQILTAAKTELTQRVATLEQKFNAFGSGITITPVPTIPPVTDPIPSGTAVYATCTINALNVRSGPGISYPMQAGLAIGQSVKVIKRQNGWAQIENPAGWVSEAYLSYQSGAPVDTGSTGATPQLPVADTFGVCNTSGLNVRSGPGVTNPIIGGITYGQRVKVLSQRSGWAQLQSPAGWVNQSYLSIT
jgi:lysozyme